MTRKLIYGYTPYLPRLLKTRCDPSPGRSNGIRNTACAIRPVRSVRQTEPASQAGAGHNILGRKELSE